MSRRRIRKQVNNADVPCGSCSLCCQGDVIPIHPEMGDRISDYDVKRVGGRWIIQHSDNGDCIYLDRVKGCKIRHKRPAICREYDCRAMYERVQEGSPLINKYRHMISDEILTKGRELIEAAKNEI